MLVKDPPVEIADRFWMLGTTAFPLYLFRGASRGVIFEGGISALGPILRKQLGQLGVGGELVRQVVVTHAHPDHVMAVHVLRDMFPHVSVAASQKAAQTLAADKAVAFFGKMDGQLTDSLVESGSMPQGTRAEPLAENRIPVDQVLAEGDLVEADQGASFRVLETPGHSDCSLSFHEPKANILIISDATGYYMPDLDFLWPNYFSDYDAYLRSIERLAGVGAEILCLSHNAVIRGAGDVADYFRRAIADTERYHQHIVDQTKAGKSVEQIAQALGADVYQKTRQLSLRFFEKNCQVLINHSLRSAGVEPAG